MGQPKKISKILIANRGEIACRIIATAKRLGIKTVAVYSDADTQALNVLQADEKVHIGPAPSVDSYLVIDKIIAAAKETGADAVHPGFGFLSENTDFAAALDKANIGFIGPPPGAIETMGDKIASKKLAKEAGVNTVPGHMDLIRDADHAVQISEDIGYPVMIKASAGGGGKGMRVANNTEEAREGFRLASSEAASAFGDDRIFIEKFIVEPRHIEIQVLGDKHGTIIHLNERECSIQRRHQKVVEEAPSPFVDEKLRQDMGAQAIALAKAVYYHSAGTVEFIVDRDKNFYFLEMNTRLQVEHPVTELITGLDIVEQMIRVEEGEKLSVSQKDVAPRGWSVETRVYAEDPLRNFLPSIGRLTRYVEPEESKSVRVDSGVYEGADIPIYYDPMIAKLVTYGKDRAAAIAAMRDALDRYVIEGCGNNLAFLRHILDQPRFVGGALTTNFIADVYPDGFGAEAAKPKDITKHAALAVFAEEQIRGLTGEALAVINGKEVTNVSHNAEGLRFGKKKPVAIEGEWSPTTRVFEGKIGKTKVVAQIEAVDGVAWRVSLGGQTVSLMVAPQSVGPLAQFMPESTGSDSANQLLSPMPGLLVSVQVAVGDKVEAGDELAVVEAMKMENILRAERDGVVKAVAAEVGSNLAVDEVILEFEA